MEIKNKVTFEYEKDGKVVKLLCDNDSPLGLIFDALMEFKGYCVERMAKSHEDETKEAEEKMEKNPVKEEEKTEK